VCRLQGSREDAPSVSGGGEQELKDESIAALRAARDRSDVLLRALGKTPAVLYRILESICEPGGACSEPPSGPKGIPAPPVHTAERPWMPARDPEQPPTNRCAAGMQVVLLEQLNITLMQVGADVTPSGAGPDSERDSGKRSRALWAGESVRSW
jgi:hypothetical protein